MAGDPAVIKVRDALGTLLSTGLTGVSVFTDRGDEEPVQESERPAVVLRIVDQQMDPPMGLAEMRHNCEVDFDIYEESLSEGGLTKALAVLVTDINSLVAGDRTLGGRLEMFELRSVITDPNETPDVGVAILKSELSFLTKRDDFTTGLGASGEF